MEKSNFNSVHSLRIRVLALRLTVQLLLLVGGCATKRESVPTHALEPLSHLDSHISSTHSWWEGFRQSSDQDHAFQLVMLEPYHASKIPVVLIHGLLSNPATWRTLLVSCYGNETIRNHFQFWVFHYPTGITYLESARHLRHKLLHARASGTHPEFGMANSDMVLIGHSMGGLIAKLQVTHSGDVVWQAVANGPFDKIECDERTRQQIHETMYFSPVPSARRVVYLATPHHGAEIAGHRLVRASNHLVRFPDETQLRYRSLLRANDVLLLRSFFGTVPTSIDHLAPTSPVLLATTRLPISREVAEHSIIGSEGPPLGEPSGDNIVAFGSAKWSRAVSEKVVHASHTDITKDNDAIAEIQRILILHLKQSETTRYNSTRSVLAGEPKTVSTEAPGE